MLMRQPQTELLDEFSEQPSDIQAQLSAQPDTDVIGFRNASFSWANTTGGSTAPTPGSGRRNFNLRIDGDLFFKKGKINLIIGPTGSGKSSLLMALLGEMHYIPAGPDSFFSLPRTGGVAYAAQESWVQNETIRVRRCAAIQCLSSDARCVLQENVIFGAPFDECRYQKGMNTMSVIPHDIQPLEVIEQCALKRDLELFAAGDQTEVGERGITLRYFQVLTFRRTLIP